MNPVWIMIETDEELLEHLSRALRSGFPFTHAVIADEIADRATAIEGPTVR